MIAYRSPDKFSCAVLTSHTPIKTSKYVGKGVGDEANECHSWQFCDFGGGLMF